MTGELVQFPSRPRRLSHEEGRAAAACVLATPISEREERASELYLDEPELLISLCELLTKQLETSPATVCEEAGFFYRFVSIPKRPIGLFDEREYFLGELALIAGTACRVLFRREEARRWFDVAETHVVLVANGTAHVARLAYQKLALAAEERRFEEVLKLAPVWSENFLQLGMPEDALKCRFLVGIALWEMGQLRESVEAFRGICGDAEKLQNVRLIAQAANNLAQLYAILGEADEALTCSRKALPLLKHLSSRVHLVKLQWGLGDLLRGQGNVAGAVEAYRAALKEARGRSGSSGGVGDPGGVADHRGGEDGSGRLRGPFTAAGVTPPSPDRPERPPKSSRLFPRPEVARAALNVVHVSAGCTEKRENAVSQNSQVSSRC